ncbi:hypothetical protein RM590_33725 [Streptomyces sp. DSM 44938]|uniref:Uncharacterized protein n=2 Tax=Streptomyces litchfieldiae TaxID=3075543 RepID=A0ABU2N164_9ACTN|nr:hypothetical protein [Streptomyces sp. DSM 44938]MDT0347491.1 hypothetical protein [Streptomyces sp. DSM 44938]
MPQHTHAHTQECRHCGGFPVVAITTGRRLPDGSRETITTTCPNHATSARTTAPASSVVA